MADRYPAIPVRSSPSQRYLATEIQVMARLVMIVHALPGHNVLPYQPRLLAPSKFREDGEHDGVSGAARLAMNVILMIKSSKIRWFLLMAANFGR